MIYTVTFNPALDYVVQVGHFTADGISRTDTEHVYPGGKGNNVAVVASNLGQKSRALGFKAGFTGDAMEAMLKQYGCDTDFIMLDEGLTRINVKVKAEQEFEINGQGPAIPDDKIRQLLDKLDAVGEGDMLVLSGSIPNTLPDDMYEKIMRRFMGRKVKVCVDAARGLLVNVLKYHPFLVKPNSRELGEVFGCVLKREEEVIRCAKKLQQMGAVNVLVSMAGDGAVLVDEYKMARKQAPPKGEVVNSVGAGDSMVAGFLSGYLQTGDYGYALKLGTAAGSATAFTSWLAGRKAILGML